MDTYTFAILLRDTSTSPCTMLVDLKVEVDLQTSNDDEDPVDQLMNQFMSEVEKLGLEHPFSENRDVYISYWGGQTTFSFTPQFITFLQTLGVKLTIDYND